MPLASQGMNRFSDEFFAKFNGFYHFGPDFCDVSSLCGFKKFLVQLKLNATESWSCWDGYGDWNCGGDASTNKFKNIYFYKYFTWVSKRLDDKAAGCQISANNNFGAVGTPFIC
ncbi:hypothetical protein LIMNO130_50569 [Limnobacter sp. 130]|nr:hypothetical protein LIMNO130_50569 [Limnobacter sp. 130]